MNIKLPKELTKSAKTIIKNNESNRKHANKIKVWLDKYDYGCDNYIEDSIHIVKGEIITDENKKEYLKVDGFELAGSNGDGVFCHQRCYGEDCYSGALYFLIEDNEYLQLFYNC
jgi:hypothetical protein